MSTCSVKLPTKRRTSTLVTRYHLPSRNTHTAAVFSTTPALPDGLRTPAGGAWVYTGFLPEPS